jgi:crotonobetainyl-CoA:carnitine CoA-transferase CaiB-like acyl-CoA transferase
MNMDSLPASAAVDDPLRLDDALEGMLVVDLSQGIAGPYCAALLGELGARVIKVEPPGGDWARRAGGSVGSSSAIFETFNRGKQGIVLDLKSAAGLADAKRLLQQADVVVENARVGAMARLGLGYPELAAENERLVCVSVSGFGQSGPYATRAATDTVMQAFTGIAMAAGNNGQPARLRLAIVDVVTGLYASQAATAALIKQLRTGRGRWIDVNLTHAMAALQAYRIADTLANGPVPDTEAFAIVGLYRARDGVFSISAASDAQVCAALVALGCEAMLAPDGPFSTAAERRQHQQRLRQQVARAVETRALDDCTRALEQVQVPCQAVLDYTRFLADPQVVSMGLFERIRTADGTGMPAVRMPGLKPGCRGDSRSPSLDEHAAQLRAQYFLEKQ